MTIAGTEATSALAEIDRVQRRTTAAAGYALASPHLVTWGLVWLLGYSACGMLPVTRWGIAWLPLIVVGIVASIIFGMGVQTRSRGRVPGLSARSMVARSLGGAVAGALFLSAIELFLKPAGPDAYLMLPALVLGLVYALVGLVTLPRFFWIGAAVFVATMAGYWLARDWLPFWIAGAGGGGLILGGLWLRKV